MFFALASKHKFKSKKGETLLLQIDIYRSNIVVLKSIQWKNSTLPKDWILVGVTQPKHV
jgi:hypothetical protein